MQARLLAALCLALSFCSFASAQIVNEGCQQLYFGAATTATFTGTITKLDKFRPRTLSARAYATNNSGTTPTLDCVVQSCELEKDITGTTAASTCSDRFTFDQCTTGACYGGDGIQTIDLTSGNADRFFRAKCTLAGTNPNYSVRIKLCSGGGASQ